jgi:hypothetical protein
MRARILATLLPCLVASMAGLDAEKGLTVPQEGVAWHQIRWEPRWEPL